jgi:hypothetical protein
MPDISILAPIADEDPRNFSELGASCGKFIDTWLEAGGEPTDDEVVGFYSLWSQSLDVPKGSGEAEEQASFYEWAYPFFVQHRNEVRRLLND